MTNIFGAQRIVSVLGLLGLILGLIFALLSFDYFKGYMAKAGLLAVCALWGTVTGAVIGHSIPRP
ncbi:hypothetical protein [Bradyrhizobium sp.]|jgi:small basic protein|uniref:hypothetical protein n=1 Tax=Bradyrhizobium sp. TaxID=376 RepID=UPI003C63CF22